MEDNRKSVTFFADAPKGKKIGTVLAWIASALLLAALFVPGFRVKFQTQDPAGRYQDIAASETYELNQAKDAWKQAVREGSVQISGGMNRFLESGQTSVFAYLSDSDLLAAHLPSGQAEAPAADSPLGILLLAGFFLLIILAVLAGVFTIGWAAFAADLLAGAELLLVYLLLFKSRLGAGGAGLLEGSRAVCALSLPLLLALAGAGVLALASVLVSCLMREPEEEEMFWDEEDENRNVETGLIDDTDTAPVTDFPEVGAASASLLQMNTGRSFGIPSNGELILGKGSQANIIISNPIISRAHAKISCRNGVCTIQDLGSKNGTFVGDQKLSGGSTAVLTDGMYITLGNEIFQFKS